MPTDLPPDYKPQPLPEPTDPGAVPDPGAVNPPKGKDSVDPGTGPNPGPDRAPPRPNAPGGDVVDPAPGWGGPGSPAPAGVPGGGLPSF